MRTFRVMLAATGLAVAVMTARAQDDSTTEAISTTTAGETGPANAAIADRYMIPVQTVLTSKIDTRNAAIGQEVTAKTMQPATLADGTALPGGTKLFGHVTQVQAASNDRPYAALTMAFDRAELKGGKSVALRSVIRTIGPPANVGAAADDSMMPGEPMGPLGGGAPGGMGAGSARGGLGTGTGGVAVGGPVRGAGQTAGGVGRTAGTAIGDSPSDAIALTQAANPAGGVVTQAGEAVSPAPRATALPGVMLATAGAANASGTLVASGRNISLESGTRITLGLITR